LPTVWFRNTWSWDRDAPRPVLEAAGAASARIEHPYLGALELLAGSAPDGTAPELLYCENETNTGRLFGVPAATPYPKDGINDHVVHGAATVNPGRRGTKCAAWYRLTVPPGGPAQVRLGGARGGGDRGGGVGGEVEGVVAARQAEAEEFYAELTPQRASAGEAAVMRQAFAGMLWGKQFYNYDVARWLDGDPAQPAPP